MMQNLRRIALWRTASLRYLICSSHFHSSWFNHLSPPWTRLRSKLQEDANVATFLCGNMLLSSDPAPNRLYKQLDVSMRLLKKAYSLQGSINESKEQALNMNIRPS
jgi:hypothetical protein